ncbi:MAG: aminotransferase class I/II-fold pyridoxal phosphate-dependent enzyme, partial [Actinomadura sp.]
MSDATTPRFRSVLDRFAAYRPGKVALSPDGRSYKLSSNESPYGPLPSVVEAITEAARRINRYPDNGSAELTDRLAARFGVPTDRVALGCGSVGVAQTLLEAITEPGAEVMYAWRSFEAYPLLVTLSGATAVQVPLAAETHDLAAMADAITERTRLIFVCNPNIPTGTVVRRAELSAFL